jgi:biopolymer transport protein ExbD
MKFYNKPRRKPTIIIVTMIDVFCVLLIFFIVATTFRKSLPAVTISLPEAKAGATQNLTEPQVISVTPNEKIYLNGKEITLMHLTETFIKWGKQNPQPPVALQADKKAPFGLIIKIMDAAKAAGFPQIPAFIDQEAPPAK